jgi:hypothetical protein
MPSDESPVSESRPGAVTPLRHAPAPLDAEAFRTGFGEDLSSVLDLGSWYAGRDLTREYDRIQQEVAEAVRLESDVQRRVRLEVFPKLSDPAGPLDIAGVYPAREDVLERIHRGLLFNGQVEACDGTIQVHDTLPLTIYQVGVSLVSYHGDQGTWHQRLFRRDLKQNLGDPVEQTLAILQQRAQRSALNHTQPSDALGELAQKTIMDYGERAVLVDHSQAVWRVGHGNPITYELLTGGGIFELMVAGTKVLRQLIEEHRKFVYVASEPRDRALLTIGQALLPGHYAIVFTLDRMLIGWFDQKRFKIQDAEPLLWDGEPIKPMQWIPHFIKRVASQVVVGVYRASLEAPAHLFYAHRDHAHYAAHIVLADSRMQPHRGFPLLIDLAHNICSSVFAGSLDYLTEAAYAAAGVPFRYKTERSSRNR